MWLELCRNLEVIETMLDIQLAHPRMKQHLLFHHVHSGHPESRRGGNLSIDVAAIKDESQLVTISLSYGHMTIDRHGMGYAAENPCLQHPGNHGLIFRCLLSGGHMVQTLNWCSNPLGKTLVEIPCHQTDSREQASAPNSLGDH
jgi:hypothetical protein